MRCEDISWCHFGNLCGVPLIPVLHQCSYLRNTVQPCVPLESIKQGCVWSTSGSLIMRRSPKDGFTWSEFWMPHTVPSETHSSLSVLVWQSGEVVMQVDISDMVLPGDIECHSERLCIHSVPTPCIWNKIKHNLWENSYTTLFTAKDCCDLSNLRRHWN